MTMKKTASSTNRKKTPPAKRIDLSNWEDIHYIIRMLMDYFQEEEDPEAVMLLASLGKHLYTKELNTASEK